MTLNSLLVVTALMLTQIAQSKPIQVVENGVLLRVGGGNVATVTVDGIPFSERAELYVVKPQWAGVHYSINNDKELSGTLTYVKEDDGTHKISFLTIDKENGVMRGKQTYELSPDRKLKVSVEANNTSDVLAVIEHAIFDLVPTWFAGRPVAITDQKDVTTTKRLPFSMTTNERKDCTVGSGMKRAVVDTRVGPLAFEFEGNTPVTMLDYRMNPWLEGKSQVWLGILSYDFPAGAEYKWSCTVQFPPKSEVGEDTGAQVATAEVTLSDRVLTAEVLKDIIVPTPKKVTWQKDNLLVPDGAEVSCNNDALEAFAQYFIEDNPSGIPFAVTQHNSDALIQLRLSPDKQMKSEGYEIRIGAKTAVLEAQTTIGLLHATRTLAQLMRVNADGTQWSLRRCEIQDWPAMAVRGVEFYTGKNAGDDQARLVRKLMGFVKMNMLIHHACYAEWKARPDLMSDTNFMSKTEIAKVYAECKRQAIEYVPFFPAYGLIEWFRFKINHPKSEKPDSSVWDAPDEQQGLAAIFEECIAETSPRYFHIAHDELYTAPTADLLKSIIYWHGWLKERGIRMMIWSDLFLFKGDSPDACNAPSPEVAAQRRDMLPKDIIITDWHYESGPPESYKSIGIFNDAGLDTIASSWFNPKNVVCFGKAAADAQEDAKGYKPTNADGSPRGKNLGQIATTWAGWNFDKKAMGENGRQLADYILTAESAWVGGYEHESMIPFDVLPVFYRLWNDAVLPPGPSEGWQADLSGVANLPLASEGEWLGFPKGENISSMPSGKQQLDRYSFNIPTKAVLMKGKMQGVGGYKQLDINVNQKSNAVAFAIAATLPFPIDIPIAKTTIHYDDSTSEVLPMRVASNVFSIDDARSGGSTPIIWKGKTKAGKPIFLHNMLWKNSHPSKTIRKISFTSEDHASSLMIFGVTGMAR